ncbi:unnamed protein product [Cuscuta epithymum]|uniref:Ubiquitin-like protease family profile domain-containing protein n=1 Tax=Cuscuta epithymum TaxID=186058 RepID=A0AAV0DMR9_9ASTE|nr:unnamed protein product [Cuscuta epithymum]CAH9142050.1 unnamed protein product [Cuscuta epithymum]
MASVQEEHALRQAALACEEGTGQNHQTVLQKRKKAAPCGSSIAKKKRVINKGIQVQVQPDGDKITGLMQFRSKLEKQKTLSMQRQEIRSKSRHDFQGAFIEDNLGLELMEKEVERRLKKENEKVAASKKSRSISRGQLKGSKAARGKRSTGQESGERRRSGRINKETEVCNENVNDVVVPDTEDGSEADIHECEEAGSDEDFVNLPKQVVRKEKERAGRPKKKEKRAVVNDLKVQYHSLYTRSSPNVVMNAISKLSHKQREQVREVGFGALLDLGIRELPSKLGYWIVDNFDPISCSLKLGKGRKIHITEEDVELVLGFPRGDKAVLKRGKGDKSEMLDEWRASFGGKDKVLPIEVVREILRCEEGGECFVRNFIILVISTLIENTRNGYINCSFINNLKDTKGIKDLNWCEYVIKALIEKKREWAKGKEKAFTGPLLFLMVLYVDRVEVYRRSVPRKVPAIMGWSTQLLRERESEEVEAGGFGLGYVDEKMTMNQGTGKTVTAEERTEDVGQPSTTTGAEEDVMQRFANKTSLFVKTTTDIMNMLDASPDVLRGSEELKELGQAANMLMAVLQKKNSPDFATPTQMDREMEVFWSNPVNLEILAEAEVDGIKRTKVLQRRKDMPNFSIGLTQDDPPNEVSGDALMGFEKNNINEKGKGKADASVQMPLNEQMVAVGGQSSSNINHVLDIRKDIEETEELGQLRRKQTAAATQKSPYVRRVIDLSAAITKDERAMSDWILLDVAGDGNEVIFKALDQLQLTRGQLMSIKDGRHIEESVINTWAFILNCKETVRSSESTSRLFAKVLPCLDTQADLGLNEDRAYTLFVEAIEFGLEAIKEHTALSKVDLFFFPIMQVHHCYVICLNTKLKRVDIIDSSSASVRKFDKYGEMPQNVV